MIGKDEGGEEAKRRIRVTKKNFQQHNEAGKQTQVNYVYRERVPGDFGAVIKKVVTVTEPLIQRKKKR